MARTARKPETPTFESALKRLEEIVRRLEDEQVPLEESLKLFAEGRRLAAACEKDLQKAENQIRLLMEDPEGKPAEVPFEADDDFTGEDAAPEDDAPAPTRAPVASEPIADGPKPMDDLPF